jgi:hypothetical protein
MSIAYYDESYPPSLWEPAPIPPTGVTAGTPGAFTPAGCDVPNNLAQLRALGSLGQTTAWAEGEYVNLDPTGTAYWDGTTWQLGVAPVADEPQTFAATPVAPEDLPPDIEEP